MGIELIESNNKIEKTTLHELVDYIDKEITSGKNPNTFPEFIRDPKENPLTSDDLLELLRLPGEIGLSEENGKVVLTIGSPGKIENKQFIRRSNQNRLCLHSHVPSEKTSAESSISAGDIIRVNFRDGKTSLLLHADGVILYGDALRDPITGNALEPLPDNREILERFLENKGYDLQGFGIKNSIDFSTIGTPKQLELSNEFAEKSGMIIERISWDNAVGMDRVLKMINLEKE